MLRQDYTEKRSMQKLENHDWLITNNDKTKVHVTF